MLIRVKVSRLFNAIKEIDSEAKILLLGQYNLHGTNTQQSILHNENITTNFDHLITGIGQPTYL